MNARLLIAGGGTGGHLFPALAVAAAWERLNPGGEVLFVGTPRGLEARILPERGKRLALLTVGQLKGGGWRGRLATLAGLPGALWQALKVVRSFAPQVVLGVGGYASAPAVAAAWLLRIPTLLHEQNALPGLTNRLLGRVADEVLLGFAEAAPRFAGRPVVVTGNPVRADLLALERLAADDGAALRLLVFGGSQGAKVFSEVVPAALAQLCRAGAPPIEVRQQARAEDVDGVRAAYAAAGVKAEVRPFIEEMAAAYGWADLVIARGGASTVAELAVVGRAALLVPLPSAADDHQTANAQALAAAGGGWLQRQEGFSADWLAHFLGERLSDRAGLLAVGRRANQLARPEAAETIARRLMTLAAA